MGPHVRASKKFYTHVLEPHFRNSQGQKTLNYRIQIVQGIQGTKLT